MIVSMLADFEPSLARFWGVFSVTAHKLLDFSMGIRLVFSAAFDSLGLGDHNEGNFIFQFDIFQKL